jgi:hypothetical protein
LSSFNFVKFSSLVLPKPAPSLAFGNGGGHRTSAKTAYGKIEESDIVAQWKKVLADTSPSRSSGCEA